MNWLVILGAALIPTVVGFIYYNPKVVGTAWMNVTGMTEEKARQGNMPVIFGVSFVLSVLLAMALTQWTIHQTSIIGLFAMQEGFGDAGNQYTNYFNNFISKYGGLHRTFGHGAIHGVFAALFIGMPLLATNALYEQKGFKYILINMGYWIITLGLMGGVICQFYKVGL